MKNFFLTAIFILECFVLQAAAPEILKQTLNPGETLTMSECYVKFNSRITVSVKSKTFQPVSVGCGQGKFQGCWLDINKNTVDQYSIGLKNGMDAKGKKSRVPDSTLVAAGIKHGLALKKGLVLTIFSHYGSADLTLSNCDRGSDKSFASHGFESKNDQGFETSLKGWMNGGPVFVMNKGDKPVDVVVAFERLSIDEPVWFYGDSYFSVTSSSRWAYYMYKEGNTHWMADHRSGGKSSLLIECFKNDLKYGTPKIAVWMLGMNDPREKGNEPSAEWLKYVEEFLSICKEKGITPVLTTIPSVPKRRHTGKAYWVRNSGYRYVDWASTVLAETSDTIGVWKDGMLSKDGVHPSAAGAAELWKAVKEAIPEIN